MIDWGLVANIAGAGFGLTILVLAILSLVAWIVGLVIRKTTKERKGSSSEDNK